MLPMLPPDAAGTAATPHRCHRLSRYRLEKEKSAMMTDETNGHPHVLSILTTLPPPTPIAGIFGMNTKDCHLPTAKANCLGDGFHCRLIDRRPDDHAADRNTQNAA